MTINYENINTITEICDKKSLTNPDNFIITLNRLLELTEIDPDLPEQSYNRLSKCWGVICFTVRDVREWGLDAIQDKPDHVSIINVPNPETHGKEAKYIASKLAKKSRLFLDRLNNPIINKK